MKRKIKLISAGLVIIAATIYCHQKNFIYEFSSQLKSIHKTYSDNLHDQEQAILQTLKKVGITSDYIETMKKNFTSQSCKESACCFSLAEKQVNPSIRVTVESVLNDFNINPSTMLIVKTNLPTCAGLSDHVIFVNEKKFSKLPTRAQKFVIGHELQHFFFKDDIVLNAITDYAERHGISTQSVNSPINQYGRFFEKRADILTALKNADYAQGYLEFTETNLKLVGDTPGITHPKNSDRLAMAHAINKQLA